MKLKSDLMKNIFFNNELKMSWVISLGKIAGSRFTKMSARRAITVLAVSLIFSNIYAENKASDYVSENTVASVVKLSSFYRVYEVEGLDDDYQYTETNDQPDFKGGKVIQQQPYYRHVGTGVVVTKTGLILSNAHVTSASTTPIIEVKKNPQGNPVYGADGKTVKYVGIPVSPQFMFVEAPEITNLKKNDDSVCLSYLAKILVEDNFYQNQYRDRSILQITDRVNIGPDGEPVIETSKKVMNNFPYVQMENPFSASFLDNKVKAIGFPGVGDPKRSAKTSGELLGYESTESSNILHSSWISGGNSGGGLFYNDKLIGINTWDNQSNPTRPLAVAQPVNWWTYLFIYAKWFYPDITLPEFNHDWALSDPSTDTYRDMAYVKILVSYKANPKEIITKGQMLLFDADWDITQIIEYREYESYFDNCWEIVQALWNNSVKDTAAYYGISEDFAGKLKNITTRQELRAMMNENALKYFDVWQSRKFVYTFYSMENNGKMVLATDKGKKYELCYVDENGDVQDSYTLTCDYRTEQGPYTIWLY